MEKIFINPKNNKQYICVDFPTYFASPDFNKENFIKRQVQICNQKLIYDFLFSFKLKGQKYTRDRAERFIDFVVKGWECNEHYAFAIIEKDSKDYAGIVHIKSNDKEMAEIGYWANAEHAGVMTPAVDALIGFAKEMGFKKLGARVKKINPASLKVLERNGFKFIKMYPLLEDGDERYWLEKTL